MPFTVVWDPAALDQLALIWITSQYPNAVTRASDQIDLILRHSSMTAGLQYGDWRVVTIDPLQFLYKVSPDDCLVQIVDVREA